MTQVTLIRTGFLSHVSGGESSINRQIRQQNPTSCDLPNSDVQDVVLSNNIPADPSDVGDKLNEMLPDVFSGQTQVS